jgi:hypothetical protein
MQSAISRSLIALETGPVGFLTKEDELQVFKKSFTTLKAYIIYSEDMYSVLNCHNVAKHAEFCLG